MTAALEQATLPYPDPDGTMTGGWSGSEASHDRAVAEATDGTLAKRQRQVLAFVAGSGTLGVTWKFVAYSLNLHHGQASGALSNLHKAGLIDRLTERRERCSVYVMPEFTDGRPTAPYGRRKPAEQAEVGYDEGDLTRAYERGRKEGLEAADRETLEFVQRLGVSMKIGSPPVPRTHHSLCYRVHPECALRAVAAFIEKSGALT